ncbi:hypothetical protein MASR2M50_35910 [Thauera sp.]
MCAVELEQFQGARGEREAVFGQRVEQRLEVLEGMSVGRLDRALDLDHRPGLARGHGEVERAQRGETGPPGARAGGGRTREVHQQLVAAEHQRAGRAARGRPRVAARGQ